MFSPPPIYSPLSPPLPTPTPALRLPAPFTAGRRSALDPLLLAWMTSQRSIVPTALLRCSHGRARCRSLTRVFHRSTLCSGRVGSTVCLLPMEVLLPETNCPVNQVVLWAGLCLAGGCWRCGGNEGVEGLPPAAAILLLPCPFIHVFTLMCPLYAPFIPLMPPYPFDIPFLLFYALVYPFRHALFTPFSYSWNCMFLAYPMYPFFALLCPFHAHLTPSLHTSKLACPSHYCQSHFTLFFHYTPLLCPCVLLAVPFHTLSCPSRVRTLIYFKL